MADPDLLEDFPSAEAFFLDEPLYRPISLPPGRDAMALLAVEFFEGSIKAYCPQCAGESVFRTDRIQSGELLKPVRRPHVVVLLGSKGAGPCSTYSDLSENGQCVEYAKSDHCFTVEFYCTRVHDHRIYFCFAVRNGHVQKIGQFPSLSDFEGATLAQYRKLLDAPLGAAYTRAVNLHAHDVGAGSFVYLRRILESLLEDAHQAAAKGPDWNEDAYHDKRITERIKALHGYLPEFLVENASLYSVLSRGVHELSEEECLAHFPVVRAAIDMILDEQFSERQRELRKEELTKAMARIKNANRST